MAKYITDKKKIAAYLDQDLKRDAEDLARKRRLSLSNLVVILLDEAVEKAKAAGGIE